MRLLKVARAYLFRGSFSELCRYKLKILEGLTCKMEEFTHNGGSYKAEYWLNGSASAEEFILWVSQKVIAGYKNYVVHGSLDKSEVINAEVEIIVNEDFNPVAMFVIDYLVSNAELVFLKEISIFVRSVTTSSQMSDFSSKRPIGLMFWFFQ